MADTTIPADIIEAFLEALEDIGSSGILKSYTFSGTEYNPTALPTLENITLIPVNYKIKEIDGTTIQQGDRKFLFLSTAIPTTTDKISTPIIDGIAMTEDGTLWTQEDGTVITGTDYNIVNVDIVAVSGVTVLYKVQGRR